jgi:hypothetical protein
MSRNIGASLQQIESAIDAPTALEIHRKNQIRTLGYALGVRSDGARASISLRECEAPKGGEQRPASLKTERSIVAGRSQRFRPIGASERPLRRTLIECRSASPTEMRGSLSERQHARLWACRGM